MKKFTLLLFMILTFFGLIACQTTTNNNPTTLAPVVVEERLSAPSNLQITGKILTWDAVSKATGYEIYLNDVLLATRTGASYDFTSQTGDQLVFRVVAKGNPAIQLLNSLPSASVAYLSNSAQEINALIALLTPDLGATNSEIFARELVRKGMKASEFEAAKDDIEAMVSAMNDAESYSDAHAEMSKFIAKKHNLEAFISAYALVMGDMMYDDALYSKIVTSAHDELVLAIVRTLEYFMDLQQAFSPALVSKISNLTTDNQNPITAQELDDLTSEIATVFLENLPSVADIQLFFLFMSRALQSFEGTEGLQTAVFNYSEEASTAIRLSIELELRFIASLDLAYFTSLLGFQNGDMHEELKAVEISILSTIAMARFKENNQALFTQIRNVLTSAQKENLFNQLKVSISSISDEEIGMGGMNMMGFLASSIKNISYALLESFFGVGDKISDAVLDYIVETNGEILRKQMITQLYMSNMYDYYSNYENPVTGVPHDNYTEYLHASKINSLELAGCYIDLMKKVLDATTVEDVKTVLEFYITYIPASVLESMFEINAESAQTLHTLIKQTLDGQASNLRSLLVDLVNYLQSANLINEMKAAMNASHQYNKTNYGADYENGMFSWEAYKYDKYSNQIVIAKHVDTFMTSARRATLNQVINAAFAVMKSPTGLASFNMTLQDVTSLETAYMDALDLFLSEAAVIRTFTIASLTTIQKERIDRWGFEIE
ncbi:MAG: hypothetical protein Q8M70_08910 [bacterium]|nr:hypothetical protein [bacterium]